MSTKPLWYRWARVYFAGGCIIGTGVLLYIYTTPTDEELISRFSPEVRAEYEQGRALRRKEQQALMEIVKKTSLSQDPIWKTGRIGSPLEKDQRNLSINLVDEELFDEATPKQVAEQVKAAQAQLAEIEAVEKQNKPWWKVW